MPQHRPAPILALLAALLALSACGSQQTGSSPVPAPQATSAPAPTAAPTPQATVAPSPAQLASALEQLVESQLPPTPTASDSLTATSAITSVMVLPLRVDDPARPLWAVASLGNVGYQQHFVALYDRAAGSWHELGRIELANPPTLYAGALRQVDFLPGRLWLLVSGDSRLIGPCCVDLLSFDGTTLRGELSYTDRTITDIAFEPASSPPAVVITVVPYLGAANPRGEERRLVFTWDGGRLVEPAGIP